jgi:hypothetical protein
MNYTKPEVNSLGDAAIAIETINPLKPQRTPFEALSNPKVQLPAYDLDE